ncbi:MAG: hypothetical protein ACOCU2_02185 [Bacillota bacterium]
MPDIYMHKRLADDIMKTRDTLDRDMFLIGAQGADPFYYGKHPLSRTLGNDFHDKQIRTGFTLMTNYVKANYSDALYSFYLGFILHATLDQHIHPYIYHHVGKYNPFDDTTRDVRGLHMRFERSIDALLIKEDTGKSARSYPLKDALPLKRVPKALLQMIDHLVYELFQINEGGILYQDGYMRMRHLIKYFMKDRTGLKTLIYKGLDHFNHTHDYFYQDLTFNRLPKEPFDYLNRNHTPWHHPITNQPSYKSIDDLYLDALLESEKIISAVDQYIKEDTQINFHDTFKNHSLNTGLDETVPHKMPYLNIYTKK